MFAFPVSASLCKLQQAKNRLKHGFECHVGYNGTVAAKGGSRHGAIIAHMAFKPML